MRGNFILLLLVECATMYNNGVICNIEHKTSNMKRQLVDVALIMSHNLILDTC